MTNNIIGQVRAGCAPDVLLSYEVLETLGPLRRWVLSSGGNRWVPRQMRKGFTITRFRVCGLSQPFNWIGKYPNRYGCKISFFLVSAFSKTFNLSAYHWGELTLVLGGGEVQDGEEADEVPHRGRDDPPALHCQSLARPGKARQAFTQTP